MLAHHGAPELKACAVGIEPRAIASPPSSVAGCLANDYYYYCYYDYYYPLRTHHHHHHHTYTRTHARTHAHCARAHIYTPARTHSQAVTDG